MTTLLEHYDKAIALLSEIAQTDTVAHPELLFARQELLYRIHVLESFQYLEQVAPKSVEISRLSQHYGAVDALVSHLLTKRRYRTSVDDRVRQARETAARMLQSVVQDYRKRFSHYMPDSDTQYAADISKTICTVLSAWIAYRETMLAINNDKEQ